MLKRRSSSYWKEQRPEERLSSGEDDLRVSSLAARVSPPRTRRRLGKREDSSAQHEPRRETPEGDPQHRHLPKLAAVEAGEAQVKDHLAYFSSQLGQAVRPPSAAWPHRLSIDAFAHLYRRHQHPHGHHFVVHQHDHPIAGPHYDLRLQFSQSSSISFAIPYGLPGDPNSRRFMRNAIETRVHNVWV